jgi:hypothetical protein
MFADKPWFKLTLSAVWIVSLSTLYFNLYHKHQLVAACHAQLSQLALMETQTRQTEAQLDASEARLDAAEAQLDKARR